MGGSVSTRITQTGFEWMWPNHGPCECIAISALALTLTFCVSGLAIAHSPSGDGDFGALAP